MKKKILTVILMMALLAINFSYVQAETIPTEDWISEKLIDYEPLQELIREYPKTKKVQVRTEYKLNETITDEEGKVVKINEKTFSDKKSMDKYQKEREKKTKNSDISTLSILPGETKYNYNYSQLKIGLAFYKYSSNYFFVACVYDWITKPYFSTVTRTNGIVGLALGDGLSMDGSSYEGRVSIDWAGSTEDLTKSDGGLSIKAGSPNAIGYSFHVSHMSSDIYGVISCKAYKTSNQYSYASAFGEYDNVYTKLGGFSISYPAGISVGIGTTRDRYTIQDSLYIY